MRILITGITGFAGSHLAEHLLETVSPVEIYGTYRWRSPMDNILQIRDRLNMVECDLQDGNSVLRMMDAVRPDWIFHLAAQSYVAASWQAPTDTINNNVIGQLNILESIKTLGLKCRMQLAGSSEEYGMVYPDEVPIKETNPLRPLSPYAVSKVGQDMMAYQYFKSYGIHLIRTRAFNHSGPRRGHVFVESNFARQIVDVMTGNKEPVIMVGNLKARRDYTDVRDVVRAYRMAIEMGEPGDVYNICSGTAYSIEEVLNILLNLSGMKIRVEEDPRRLRPSDVPLLLGDNTKFRSVTGWKPEIPLEKTLRDLLDYWKSNRPSERAEVKK
jgi:GDP-4-dehydro-6-deoxy-D-mannose reductase